MKGYLIIFYAVCYGRKGWFTLNTQGLSIEIVLRRFTTVKFRNRKITINWYWQCDIDTNNTNLGGPREFFLSGE